MARKVDVVVNFQPNKEIGIYDYLGIPRDAVKRFDPESYLSEMDRFDIAMTGIVPNVSANGIGGEVLGVHVDEVAPIINAHPDRFFGWVGINPLEGMKTLRYIEYGIKELGFKAVHVYPHWFGVPVNDRIYWPIYAKCCELGVPIAVQAGSNTPRCGARVVARPILLDDVAFHFPELKLIGLHIGYPWMNEMTLMAQNHENVFIIADAYPPSEWGPDLVGYINEKEWLNKDGSHKVMWGTDWPVQTFEKPLKEIDELGFAPEIKDRLIGENAIRVLGLDG
jgi:predicted TIM-barrel fold metal-dependent hydrolase